MLFWISRLFCLAAISTVRSQNIGSPVLDLGYAKYKGTYNESLHVNTFYGLRYAQPPTGKLRWRAPQPIERSNNTHVEVIDATRPGPSCVQGNPFWTIPGGSQTPLPPAGSEDCLRLDIVQPANLDNQTKLPVLVQIHGGGYTLGDSKFVPGYALVNHSDNALIFISIQYRLGAYGFLYSEEIAADGGTNAGLLDQRLALDWVQRHASSIGGDPAAITIYGGSAGGGSVTSQMIMYGGVEKPPFRAAIAEYPWWQPYLSEEQLLRQYGYLLRETACENLQCLRVLDAAKLANASQATYIKAYVDEAYGYGSFYYGPYVDKRVIKDLPSKEFKAGHFTKIPLLLDRDQYEGYAFSNQSITTLSQETGDLRVLYPYADEKFIDELYKLYPASDFNSTFFQRQAWFGDAFINCPTYYIGSSMASAGQTVYKMVFNAGSQLHAATGPFLFSLDYATSPGANVTTANIMKDWFLSFVIYLDPAWNSWSGIRKPFWGVYQYPGSNNARVMSVNYTEIGMVDEKYYDRTKRCDFLWEHGTVVQNKI
ncbi:alpha/beta-hydrolase [Zopfia rhizophila CBS 207.26]|uniref:Alpha/beta-hydrolase n=1 Tax=Zopfia rhizophila CBS 207.26 TaxID=1314779 RepID=A0A6A6E203_9PEZI|nr:alpha/beta-hydrolase [Zopfia rhizophila CBS 207.26]